MLITKEINQQINLRIAEILNYDINVGQMATMLKKKANTSEDLAINKVINLIKKKC